MVKSTFKCFMTFSMHYDIEFTRMINCISYWIDIDSFQLSTQLIIGWFQTLFLWIR